MFKIPAFHLANAETQNTPMRTKPQQLPRQQIWNLQTGVSLTP